MSDALFVFVRIPEAIAGTDRGEKYEDPIDQVLQSEGLGSISGGGAMLSAPDEAGERAIEWCGIDVDLSHAEQGLKVLRKELKRLNAPRGTILEYTLGGISYEADLYESDVFDMEN